MKQLSPGQIAVRLLGAGLVALGWALSALGGVVSTTAQRRRETTQPKAEIDRDGHIVKEGSTDFR